MNVSKLILENQEGSLGISIRRGGKHEGDDGRNGYTAGQEAVHARCNMAERYVEIEYIVTGLSAGAIASPDYFTKFRF
jgi:hypothetical protein